MMARHSQHPREGSPRLRTRSGSGLHPLHLAFAAQRSASNLNIMTCTGAPSVSAWKPFTCVCLPSRVNGRTKPSSNVWSTVCGQAVAETTVDSRRAVLQVLVSGLGTAVVTSLAGPAQAKKAQGDWSSPGLAAPEDDSAPKFFKTQSGVKVQELAAGSGPEARSGDTVVLDFVLRRSNGYFIYSTVEGVSFQPRDVPTGPVTYMLGQGGVIPGLEDAVIGMRTGAKRRALVPPGLGYEGYPTLQPQMPTYASHRQLINHRQEPLLFEFELQKIRNRS